MPLSPKDRQAITAEFEHRLQAAVDELAALEAKLEAMRRQRDNLARGILQLGAAPNFDEAAAGWLSLVQMARVLEPDLQHKGNHRER